MDVSERVSLRGELRACKNMVAFNSTSMLAATVLNISSTCYSGLATTLNGTEPSAQAFVQYVRKKHACFSQSLLLIIHY